MMLTRKRKSETSILDRLASDRLSKHRKNQKYLLGKCRVCLDNGEIPIFGVNDISQDVTEFGNIQVAKDDSLPQYLCEECYTLLEAAILFRNTAQEAEKVLHKTDYSASDDSDCKPETEPYIKREYLELIDISDSELDDFDRIKNNISEDEISNCNTTISEADTQESNDCKEFQSSSLKIKKEEEEESINDADSDMVMIIVSEKGEQKYTKIEKSVKVNDIKKQKVENSTAANTELAQHKKECEICHAKVDESSYNEHLKKHREKYKTTYDRKYGKVECKVCLKKIGKAYINYHLKMHGTPEEQAQRTKKCPICNRSINYYYYNDHVRRVHDKKNNKSNEPVKKLKQEQQETKHIKCPVCDKEIKESEFKLHLEKHGNTEKRYVCDKCGKVLKHPSAFKTHQLTHGNELKYKCQFCPYRGLHIGLLRIHVRTHTGDYNYKCTYCPAKFINKSNLSRHLQRHSGICQHKCEKCDKGFYTKREVVRHIQNVHSEERNHICELCGKAFAHRDNMLSHQLRVHKREKIGTRGRMPSYLKLKSEQAHLDESK